jgi:hypothetical protein
MIAIPLDSVPLSHASQNHPLTYVKPSFSGVTRSIYFLSLSLQLVTQFTGLLELIIDFRPSGSMTVSVSPI